MQSNRSLSFLVAVATGAFATTFLSSLSAQAGIRTIPKVFHNVFGEQAWTIDGTFSAYVYQQWFHGDNFERGQRITAIALRPQQRMASAAHSESLEYKMEDTSLGFAQIGTAMAKNISSSATVVFKKKLIKVPARGNAQHPFDAVFLALDAPFVFKGPNFILQAAATSRSTGAVHFDGATMNSPFLHRRSPSSCGATLLSNSTPSDYILDVYTAPPQAPLFFMLGLENVAAGPLRFPLDLTPIGMNGCFLGFDPLVFAAVKSDANGHAKLTVPYQQSAEVRVIHAQVLHATKSNAVGLATSNTAAAVIGDKGLFRGVFSLDGVTACCGFPRATNSGTVYLLK